MRIPDWDRVADEQVFALSCSPADDDSTAFRADLGAQAEDQFVGRLNRHQPPTRGTLRWTLPTIGELRWDREILELPPADAQQLTVLLPADRATEDAVTHGCYERAPPVCTPSTGPDKPGPTACATAVVYIPALLLLRRCEIVLMRATGWRCGRPGRSR
jgi:hypothetical protein